MKKEMRPYQTKLAREVSIAYKEGLKGVMMQSCTGSGKTFTAAYIVEKYTITGRVVLWLVHREELLMQAAMTFAHMGIKHRLVCAATSQRAIMVKQFKECGKSMVDEKSLVVIASIQTIVRRLDKLDWLQPSQIIADEAHLSLADTWVRVIQRWPEARLLGLSATPWRLDKKPFARLQGGMYDVMVQGPAVTELMAQGSIAKYKIYAPPVHLKQGVKMGRKGNDISPDSLAEELDDKVVYGDVVSHYRMYSHGLPAIAQCPTVSSAEKFAQAFRDAGYKAICIDGNTDDSLRRDSLAQLGRGEIDVVTSCSILTEGTDIPFATTAILLRRTESLSMYLQFAGRVLRPHPQKPFAIILDCVGVVKMHGLPDDDFEWNLEGEVRNKSKEDREKDEQGDEDCGLMTCPECQSIVPAGPSCAACGHVMPPKKRKDMKQVDGDLVELTGEALDALRRKKRALQGAAETVEDLIAGGAHRKQAEKIIEARAAKRQLQEDILERCNTLTEQTGRSMFQMFDVSAMGLRRLKPKELRELLARVIAASGNDNTGGLNIRVAGA